MAGGRPTDYTPELGQEICEAIASSGYGLPTLCKQNPHWPNRSSIFLWLRKYPEFSDRYHQAKKDQVSALVDDILEISDDSSQDALEDEDGNVRFNSEFAARSRLRVDTRKWIAAKLVPRLYGDNALARELADEIDEFRKKLEAKHIRKLTNEENGNTQEGSEEE
jgi:hypothetical protein